MKTSSKGEAATKNPSKSHNNDVYKLVPFLNALLFGDESKCADMQGVGRKWE
jgi:hypothetical protein